MAAAYYPFCCSPNEFGTLNFFKYNVKVSQVKTLNGKRECTSTEGGSCKAVGSLMSIVGGRCSICHMGLSGLPLLS